MTSPRSTRRRFLKAMGLAAATAALPLRAMAAAAKAAQEPFAFVQLTDTQLGFGGYDHDVAMLRLAVDQINALKPDFVLHCGDFVHNDHDEKSWRDSAAGLKGLKVPLYAVPGNHDPLDLYAKYVGKPYGAFEHKGCTFVGLNTIEWWNKGAAEKKPARPARPGAQETWLTATLREAAAKRRPIVVFGHIALWEKTIDEKPAYMNLPPTRRKALLTLFESAGVATYLTGHAHCNNVLAHKDIQLVTTASTSKNNDGTPAGYRVWTIGPQRPFAHEYVPLKGGKAGAP
ncbi:MAG TPA: metallophosphoesterase [Phycisphaerae bacterium]|nr:metallophosphoesterase [Phycisphaerae bacterium]